ncbi:hypothetical protein HPB51_008535 [Rhipicephalus microplus]|uniref:Uncharacterized protein n=1 Tax=Rhipicephalus microplus TaxID=6941 RepID=A0A9J6ESB2_RHIMP|nr:hypothetical protein HPB51_008535 [Rhipicephalus microplus]
MRDAGAGAFITLLHSSHCKVDKRGRKHPPPFTPGSRSSFKRLFGATGHFCVRAQDCGSKMKRHSATTKQRSLASYFKKVRTDEADGEEPPPSKDKTLPFSALVESQARPNFCSDSGECTGLYESPENEHKQDTHAPPGNDGGRSATPSDLCSTVNAGQSDTFTTGQCPRKITNVEMALPRITGRQMQRSNVPSATPGEYYRRNVYLPLLADFENQLRDRFYAHKKVVVGLKMLLQKFYASASLSDIDDAVQFYLGDIPSANVIEAEFTLWVNKYCQIEEKNRPACALQALEMCNRDFFSKHPQPTFYPGDFTRVDVDPGTDFFHIEKAEELPSKSYEQRQIDRTSTAQHPSRTSSDPRTSPHRILQVAEKEKLPRLNFPLGFKSQLKAKPS